MQTYMISIRKNMLTARPGSGWQDLVKSEVLPKD